MPAIRCEISVSLDGFIAGPEPSLEDPLGRDGERLHEWVFGLRSWRERHGHEGGSEGPDSDLIAEGVARTGSVVMGRRMFSGGSGPWDEDPRANGWWGEEPPFGVPVFVVTHHPREPLVLGDTTFRFVTGGVEEALAQARDAARERDVGIGGGAAVVQQALAAGLLDELLLHVVPVLLGGGTRLFAEGGGGAAELDQREVIASEAVTHLRYGVARAGR